MKRISCIICAHNEAGRIGGVLSALQNHPLIAETIVVDDGSTDGTREAVARFDFARLVCHEKNLGKSAAFVTGIKEANGDTLLALDADLIGITARDITNLIEPVLSGVAEASFSMRSNTYLNLSTLWGFDYISGERVFPRSLVESHLSKIAKLPSFGLEVFLNRLIIEKKLRIASIDWMHIKNPDKTEKSSLVEGVLGQLLMVSDILQVAPIHEVVSQHIRLFAQTAKKP